MTTNLTSPKFKLALTQTLLALIMWSSSICQIHINKASKKIQTNKQSDSATAKVDSSAIELTSGTIYFSGDNFQNVVKITINKENKSFIQSCFSICVPKSLITYENVFYKDYKGILHKMDDKTSKVLLTNTSNIGLPKPKQDSIKLF